MRSRARAHTHMCVIAHVCVCARACVRAHVCVCARARMRSSACVCACSSGCVCAHMLVCVRARARRERERQGKLGHTRICAPSVFNRAISNIEASWTTNQSVARPPLSGGQQSRPPPPHPCSTFQSTANTRRIPASEEEGTWVGDAEFAVWLALFGGGLVLPIKLYPTSTVVW